MRNVHCFLAGFGHQAPATTLLTLALFVAGCGVVNDRIVISCPPMAGVQKVPGADAVGVQVQISDARLNKSNVGKKGNEYDFLGEIIPQADLAVTIVKAIETELLARGFEIKQGNVIVFAELTKFFSEFKGFPEKVVAEFIMSVQVKTRDGQIVFVRTFTGQGINTGVMLRSGSNAKVALDKALQDAVSRLFNDRAFIDAILQAGR